MSFFDAIIAECPNHEEALRFQAKSRPDYAYSGAYYVLQADIPAQVLVPRWAEVLKNYGTG